MGNLTENKLNAVIIPADITTINASIAAIAGKIPAASLTEDQRTGGGLLGVDVDNKVFIEDCINEIGISGTGIIPSFINATFLRNDFDGYAFKHINYTK